MKIIGAKDERGRGLQTKELVVDWRADDLSRFRTAEVLSTESGSNLIPDWTRTLVDQPLIPGGSTVARVPLLRVAGVSNVGTSTRINQPIEGTLSYNCEVKVLMLDRNPTAAGATQGGIHLRMNNNVGDGMINSYIVWHDVVFGIESWINIDYWRRNPADQLMIQGSTEASGGGSQDIPGLRRYVPVNFGSKIGTLVTLNVDYNHGIYVNDNIQAATPEVDDYSVVVTAVTNTTVQYTSSTTASNPVYNSGSGYIMNRSVMPYFLKARLVDNTMFVKAWRMTDAEPDWDSPTNSMRMIMTNGLGPSIPGYCGIYTGHMTGTANQQDFGSFEFRSLD